MRRSDSCGLGLLVLLAACGERDVDWPHYLGDLGSSQYSTLAQIHRENVFELELAWSYQSGGADPEGRSQIQCNPLIVDGVLYGTSPRLDLFALDAATGEELWTFTPASEVDDFFALGVNRGVAHWNDRILYSAGQTLHAVDKGTGVELWATDLHTGFPEEAWDRFITSNTPGVVFEDLYITGHRASEALPSVPGDIRAFDVRTGELVWSFHTIPHPGELGNDTWPEGSWERAGGANAWAGLSLDAERGVVFAPTGSAAYDFYGGDRPGQNLFANTLLALDARTGERRWHYQIVRHDIWDRDLPAPPNLITLDGTDAVAQITKSGHVFVFDRETGTPLIPIYDTAFPASDLDGEATWPTQPWPTAPPPFSRQRLTADNVRPFARERLERLRSDGPFTPPSREGTVILPGFDGGGEWGGAAYDPETTTLYVNASEMPWVLTMVEVEDGAVHSGRLAYSVHCGTCHGADRGGDPIGVYPALTSLDDESYARDVIRDGQGVMPSFEHLDDEALESLIAYLFDRPDPHPDRAWVESILPYTSTGYHRFVDENGDPAIEPPWGTLTAIDLAHAEIRWQVPLGGRDGTENYGGPVVTAGGLIFIAATKDERFRAFDKTNGELLWEVDLPAGGYATPATYSVSGRQFVVIAAGGGKMGTRSGHTYLAFAPARVAHAYRRLESREPSRRRDRRVMSTRLWLGYGTLVALATLGVVLEVGEPLSTALYDQQTRLLRAVRPVDVEEDVVIVGLDEATIEAYPEPMALWHGRFGELLRRLAEAGPALIVWDIVLPDRSFAFLVPESDRALLSGMLAATRNAPVVIAQTVDERGRRRKLFAPIVSIVGEDAVGLALVPSDVDGVVRRVEAEIDGAATLFGASVSHRGLPVEDILINYTVGPPLTYLPMRDVLDGHDAARFANKVVYVGAVLPFEDRHPTPLGELPVSSSMRRRYVRWRPVPRFGECPDPS